MDLPERLLPRVSRPPFPFSRKHPEAASRCLCCSRLGIRRVNFEAYNRDQLHTILARDPACEVGLLESQLCEEARLEWQLNLVVENFTSCHCIEICFKRTLCH